MVHDHESGSAVRIFFKFCTMEGVNRVMKMIIIFSKNIFVWGKWTILSPKMAHHHETGSAVRFFLKFCRMKGVHEHFISCFLRKNFIWGKLIFLGHFFTVWLGMVEIESGHCYYWIFSQAMISFMITTGSLNSLDMIRIHKQSRHDFSVRHLCDGCCMEIMWYLCVEVKIQQRVINGFIKLL